MDIRNRIDELYSSFTTGERRIADYIAENAETVVSLSAKELGKECEVSAPTVVRFARTLGYSGFPALKIDMMMGGGKEVADLTKEIGSNESIASLVNTTYQHRIKALDETIGLIDDHIFSDVVSSISDSQVIYLVGVGGSGIVCYDFAQKLIRIGKKCIFMEDAHVQMVSLASITDKDMLIAVSYSGETNSILEAVRVAKSRGAHTIGISQLGKTSLSKEVDSMLYIPLKESSIRAGAIASRDASLFITDLLYLSLVSNSLDEVKEMLKITRSWTKAI